MPYNTNKDLPQSVQNVLPEHAQDIYRESFNNAWEQYKEPEERRGSASREETSHRVAWSAVKEKYSKENGKWVSKD